MTDPRNRLPPAVADFPARYARTARFSTGTPRNLTVTDAGSQVFFCRSNAPDDTVLCLWAIDVGDGTERLLADPRTLGSDDAELPAAERARRERARESAAGIVAYSVDRSGSTVCFALSGSLFVLDVASGEVRTPALDGTALDGTGSDGTGSDGTGSDGTGSDGTGSDGTGSDGTGSDGTVFDGTGSDGTVFDPRLDPTGAAIAYVDGSALRVIDVAGLEPLLERSNPDPLVGYGRAEFIAAEEMQRSRGFWWSPDGDGLLVARVDENPVDEWWIGDPAHPDRRPTAVRYPAAGTANATVALEYVRLDGSARAIAWDDDGHYEYLTDVVWSAERAPLLVRQTRDQRLVSMAEVALDDLALTERHRVTDDIWVELIPGSPTWCDRGLLTVEDLDGVRRLLLDGERIGRPDLNVRSIIGVLGDDDRDCAVLISAWASPTDIQVYSVELGTGPDELPLAITTHAGVHNAVLAGSTIVLSTALADRPGTTVSVQRLDLENRQQTTVASISDHATDPGFGADPAFTLLGSDRLTSAVFLPSWHDGESSLPVVLDPYGGPHAQRVLEANNLHLVSRWLAEHGYAVLVTDGRGTPGRGPTFERAVHGNLADPVLDDQIAALDDLLTKHSFLDPDRVGIRGWSFGGYLAALAVLRRPDRFHAAIAGAPVTTWQLYDTHYTERYLGHPDRHPEHYRASNLFVEGEQISLDRPLLLIHGLADDNVVAAHTLRFSTELLASGCAHQVLPLSGVTHMTPQEAVAENLLRVQLRFFDDTIGRGAS